MTTQIQVPEWNPREKNKDESVAKKEPGHRNEKSNDKIWEKREDESRRQFEAFKCYRDMGSGRTLAKVDDEVSYSLQNIKRISSTKDWGDRVHAYDKHLDRVETKSKKEQIQKAYEKLYANLPELIDAALDKAKEGNTRMIRDLLDRTLGDAEKHLHEFSDNDDEDVEDVLERAFDT